MLTIDKIITDNNKLIAEFIGAKSFSNGTVIFPRGENDGRINNPQLLDDLKYHSDWNRLIPVIEKIESLGYYVSIMKSNVTCCKDGGISPIFEKYDYKDKLETTWLAVAEFIKQYNDNKL